MTVTRREAIKVDEWVAFFGDYRDLTTGLLYQKGKEPQAFLNIASVFEVVNKMHLDMALRDLAYRDQALEVAREALIKGTEHPTLGGVFWRENALTALDNILKGQK